MAISREAYFGCFEEVTGRSLQMVEVLSVKADYITVAARARVEQ